MTAPIRSAEQAGRFLESLIRIDPRPYASRAPFAQQAVRRLLERVGNPHRRLRVIHVAGSKGKGSTALLTEAILQAAGRRTGTYTSPHLQRWTERFRIAGREVDGQRLAAVVERLRPHVEALALAYPDDPPSFFDAATAAALLLFAEEAVEIAVVETGLGGRLDATNVVQPAVVCITGIELEHTDKLGTTLAEIAREKAGIIKPGIPAVIGELPPAAMAEIVLRAAAVGAPLRRLGVEIRWSTAAADGLAQRLNVGGPDWAGTTVLPVPARHLAHNAALAAACVRQLGLFDAAELAEAVRLGIADAHLPGRVEILSRAPWVIVDSAHTAVSAQALATTLAALPARPIHLVVSISAGKDPRSILSPLLCLAEAITVTRAEPLRSLAPETVAAAVQACSPGTQIRVDPDPVLAVQTAYRALPPQGLLCATGSVYMAGRARTVLEGLNKANETAQAPASQLMR